LKEFFFIQIYRKRNKKVFCHKFMFIIQCLKESKVWERYGKVWAICDPYVGMIWDSIDIIWDWYGV
jgi:hypothetical protein